MNSKSIARRLGATGLCVCPHFLSAAFLSQVAAELDETYRGGQFRRAGIGQGKAHVTAPDVRSDEIFWLTQSKATPVQARLWRKIDLLKMAINRTLFLGLKDFEGHYAVYGEGGFYVRHKDSFRGDSARVVSFVLYLNRDWRPIHGGQLRIYHGGASGAESFTDVEPVGGTLVCFLSRETEHEVLLSHRPRYSLTGWFKI